MKSKPLIPALWAISSFIMLSIPAWSANENTNTPTNETYVCTISLAATPIGVYCGEITGSIDVTITGGTAPYTIEWDNNDSSIWAEISTDDNTYTIPNIPRGMYKVSIRDKNGCRDEVNVMMDDNASDLTYTIEANDPCAASGSMIIRIAGASAPYWVILDGPTSGGVIANSNAFRIDNLLPGAYKVTVDKDGCGHDQTTNIITTPTALGIDIAQMDNNVCDELGNVKVNITGGTSEYLISWHGASSGITQATESKIVQNLVPGDYTFTIRDANFCTSSASVTVISTGTDLYCELTQTPAICDNMGQIDVSINGGYPTYRVDYSGPITGSVIATTTGDRSAIGNIPNLPAGNYTIVVTDSRGCSATESITVSETESNLSYDVLAQPQICESNAGVHLTISGGKPDYSISYSGATSGNVIVSSSGTTFIPLPFGNYTFTVVDGNGCSASESATVGAGTNDLHCRLVQTHAICHKLGSIEVIITGGKPGFTVSWTTAHGGGNTAVSPDYNYVFEVPCPGIYDITVTDANGCVVMESTEVKQLENNLAFELFANPGVHEGNGWIEVYFQQGRSPYTIDLTGPVNETQITNGPIVLSSLPSGLYSVFIVDANGCDKQIYIEVPKVAPEGLVIDGMRVGLTNENPIAEDKQIHDVQTARNDIKGSRPLIYDSQVTTTEFVVYQNFPNPFKLSTTISFNLPESMKATITILDHLGKTISRVESDFAKGYNQFEFDRKDLGTGVYYYNVSAGQFSKTTRMLHIE